MVKPVCVKCQVFYRPKKNGITLEERAPATRDALPGARQPSLWGPYKLWAADLWECPACDHQIIQGSGNGALAERHETIAYEETRASAELDKALYVVNDC